jgi:hypothetical protein
MKLFTDSVSRVKFGINMFIQHATIVGSAFGEWGITYPDNRFPRQFTYHD